MSAPDTTGLREHNHAGPDWRCEACKPLADVLRARMRWASVHWGGLHEDAWPSLARAIHDSDWLAAHDAEVRRDTAERTLREAADAMPWSDDPPGWLRDRAARIAREEASRG